MARKQKPSQPAPQSKNRGQRALPEPVRVPLRAGAASVMIAAAMSGTAFADTTASQQQGAASTTHSSASGSSGNVSATGNSSNTSVSGTSGSSTTTGSANNGG